MPGDMLTGTEEQKKEKEEGSGKSRLTLLAASKASLTVDLSQVLRKTKLA